MYGVPYSSDEASSSEEAESLVELEQEQALSVCSQTDHSRRKIRKGSTKSYARWWTPHKQPGARSVGNQIPHESVQEAYSDSRSTATSQDDDSAYTPRHTHWAAAWFSRLWRPSSPPQLPQQDVWSSADDSDVSFREPLGPPLFTRSSQRYPAPPADTTARLSFFEQLYEAIRNVFHESNRFAESSLPVMGGVLFLVYLVQFGIMLYPG